MAQGLVMDELVKSINWKGPYQIKQVGLLLATIVPCAFNVLSVMFIGKHVEYRCASQNETYLLQTELIDGHLSNVTVEHGRCEIHVLNESKIIQETTCLDGFEYDEPKSRSFVTEWDLVCERTSLSDLTQTVLSLGMLAGAFIFPVLADRIGRKPVHVSALLGLLGSGILLSFSTSFTMFVIVRFFLGAFQQGTGLTSGIIFIELLPTEKRHLSALMGSFVWSSSLVLLSGIGYLTKDLTWRNVELILSAFSLVVLLEIWMLDEPLRWLVVNNKTKKAEKIIKRAAKQNKIDVTPVLELFHGHELSALATHEVEFTKNATETDCNQDGDTGHGHQPLYIETTSRWKIITNKYILRTTSISCFLWFTDSVVYYGLHLTSVSLTDDLYLSVFLTSVVELPVCLFLWGLINRIGRKLCLQIFHIVAAVALIVSVILSTADFAGREILLTCCPLIGKFSITLTFAIIFLYSPELYPTNFRNAGLGICSMAARVSLMVAPYSRTFAYYIPWGPGAVFAALSLIAAFLLRFLPETCDHELPQTVEDLDNWFSGASDKNSKRKCRDEKKTNQYV